VVPVAGMAPSGTCSFAKSTIHGCELYRYRAADKRKTDARYSFIRVTDCSRCI